ncbi:MAG: PRK06851 family protein [Clostridia bacterium]|nr:PRK06851 family protein [Clostridia bacterium]MDD4680765.1 PRK06851 family protein [Clostridia bacterium]
MAEQGKIRKMFPGGNTTRGSYFMFENMIQPATNRIFIIKGGPGVGKSTFINSISREMIDRGYDVEHHHCSTDPDSLDGMVIPQLGVALLDGTSPHIFDPSCPGALDEIVNFGEYWDENILKPHMEEVQEINKRGSMHFKTAFHILKQSKMAYDQSKWYVEESIDKPKYNRIQRFLVESVLEGMVPNYETAPKARHLFASALTPKGIVDFKDTLISRDMKVYSIKGQPGTGVKEMIERVAKAAEEMGLYTEQYHCPFEPDRLDMLIITAARIAVMNSTQPEHSTPKAMEGISNISQVEEIDLGICIKQDILAMYKEERADAEKRYRDLLEKGISHIAEAKAAHGEREKFYYAAMNYEQVNEKRNQILGKILQYT